MNKPLIICIVLILGGCALAERLRGPPEPVRETRPPRVEVAPQPSSSCFTRLDRVPGLKYRRLPPVSNGACGYSDGVQLLDIGVPMPGLTAVSCPAALALHDWIHDGVRPAARRQFGSEVVRINSFGSYACRTRNGEPQARLSEHARANAVDVATFTLASGRTVSVKSGWRGGNDEQRFLRAVHKAGCERFRAVIGPDADRFHQDHIHLDVGSDSYCR